MMLTAFLLLLLMGGCAGVGPPPGGEAPASQAIEPEPVWPPPPAIARIGYLAAIGGTADLPTPRSFFRRLGELLLGKSETRLVRPTGVASRGHLLAVADPGTPALFLIDRAEGRLREVTRANGDRLVSPVAVAIAEGDTVYLGDSYLRRIYVYDDKGRLRNSWGGAELRRPTGLAFDNERGRLYVADASAHRVHVYDPEGNLIFSFGRRGIADGEFNWPSQLCLDADGRVYVVDCLNFRVQVFDAEGRFLSKFGHRGNGSGDFARPKGIGVDSQGHVYVVDALFDNVQIFDRTGRFLLAFGGRGAGRGELWLPTGLAIDVKDDIYVADSYNQRVDLFRFLGVR